MSFNVKSAYSYSLNLIKEHKIDEPEFKARTICCECAGINNNEFELNFNKPLSKSKLDSLLGELISGTPLQYVIKKWDFYGRTFSVGPGVLIPRPETEELTEHVLSFARGLKAPVCVDLCSGSGCIGITVAKEIPPSTVFAVEKSTEAYSYLKINSQNQTNFFSFNNDIKNINFLFKKIPMSDIIISNPPYIRSSELNNLQAEVQKEPRVALDGGKDGLDFYRIISTLWVQRLKRQGMLFLEIGDDQGKGVCDILEHNKYLSNIKILSDMSGNDRFAFARRI